MKRFHVHVHVEDLAQSVGQTRIERMLALPMATLDKLSLETLGKVDLQRALADIAKN